MVRRPSTSVDPPAQTHWVVVVFSEVGELFYHIILLGLPRTPTQISRSVGHIAAGPSVHHCFSSATTCFKDYVSHVETWRKLNCEWRSYESDVPWMYAIELGLKKNKKSNCRRHPAHKHMSHRGLLSLETTMDFSPQMKTAELNFVVSLWKCWQQHWR